jgi:dTDP-4-dehydrorhamnose 3,5-epimerase
LKVTSLEIPEVVLIEPRVFEDERGYFMEAWVAPRYAAAGFPESFVQDNLSRSMRGVIRGLHLQHPFGQGKIISVPYGEVFDVAVDVRVGSPTFGRWASAVLSESNRQQLYVPPGFAHGLCVTSDTALIIYKCTELYHPEFEIGIAHDDADLSIAWPGGALLSPRDREFPRLRAIDRERLPRYSPEAARR